MEFASMKSSRISKDLLFSNSNFNLYGDILIPNSPKLFIVDKYRYVIINPEDIISNKKLAFKMAAYLFHNEVINDDVTTYFFGDITKCSELGETFENQTCKYVSYEMVEEWFPKNIKSINNYIINYFLKQQKHYGQEFQLPEQNINYLYFIPTYLSELEQIKNRDFITQQLFNKDYLHKKSAYDNKITFELTDLAIETFEKHEESTNSKQAFIAIKFADNEERIQAIQNAISECGYIPCDMTEHQTNNWIMPEIFHQIQLSKFVVVDLSLRCDGAYYEAGYAHALEKEVIHLYDTREKEVNPLHFDVAQKSTVMYDSIEDLKAKLIKRIKATIK